MPTEDLTTYTEVDPDAVLSESATTATITALAQGNAHPTYLYKDKGASFFSGSFRHNFEFNFSAITNNSGMSIYGVFAGVGDRGNAGNGYNVMIYKNGANYAIFLEEYNSGFSSTSDYNFNLSTTYYCQIYYDGATTLKLYIYSDAPHTTLLNTFTKTVATANFRYIYAVQGNSTSGSGTSTGTVTNLDLSASAGVTGSNFSFRDLKKHVLMFNSSGSSLSAGDVVIFLSSASGLEITTTTSAGNNKVLGMAVETIASGAWGRIQISGKTTVLKVNGTTDIAIGDYLSTHTVAGIAAKALSTHTAFAIALEAYTGNDSNGVVDAIILPSTRYIA